MSNPAVRAAARAMVTDPGWPTPYYGTTNVMPDRADINDETIGWCTLQFDVFARRPMGSNCWREDGEITLLMMSPAGASSAGMELLWALVEPAITSWAWPADFHLRALTTPQAYDHTPQGMWARWDVGMTYTYDETP